MTTVTGLVFSDVDETLISCKSMFDFLEYYLTGRYAARGARRYADVRRTLADRVGAGEPREQVNRDYYRAWVGEPAAEVTRWGRRWYADRSARPGFYISATLAALRRHRGAGAAVVLVSGSFPAVLRPIAAAVGAAHLLCVEPAATGGVLTGDIIGVPMIGEAKRAAVRQTLTRYPHLAAQNCYGYGDHVSDLPMLTEVGHPVVVGAGSELAPLLPGAPVLPA